jgi:hypothetical protein
VSVSHAAQVPMAAQRYFASRGIPMHRRGDHPVIAMPFRPEAGWRRYPIRKRVSTSALRRLRADGVTHVQLSAAGQRHTGPRQPLADRAGSSNALTIVRVSDLGEIARRRPAFVLLGADGLIRAQRTGKVGEDRQPLQSSDERADR